MGLSVGSWALRGCKGRGRGDRCDGQTLGTGWGEGDVGWEKEWGREGGSGCRSMGARWGICPMALLATGV